MEETTKRKLQKRPRSFIEIPKRKDNIWFQLKKDKDGITKIFMCTIDPITKVKEEVPVHG